MARKGNEVGPHGFDVPRFGDIAQLDENHAGGTGRFIADRGNEGAVVATHGHRHGIFYGACFAIRDDAVNGTHQRRIAKNRCDMAPRRGGTDQRLRGGIGEENPHLPVEHQERVRQSVDQRVAGGKDRTPGLILARRVAGRGFSGDGKPDGGIAQPYPGLVQFRPVFRCRHALYPVCRSNPEIPAHALVVAFQYAFRDDNTMKLIGSAGDDLVDTVVESWNRPHLHFGPPVLRFRNFSFEPA